MLLENNRLESLRWTDLTQMSAYEGWKKGKIKTFENLHAALPIGIESLGTPSKDSVESLKSRCAEMNFAIYEAAPLTGSVQETAGALLRFAAHFGLRLKEDHRSEDETGVVALTTSDEKSKRGYIPYTPRPLNWHTDGYYAPSGAPIKSFVLHCHTAAAKGGENQIIDPEVAYLRLRDTDPKMLQAFFHPQAMTIPANEEPDGTVRRASVGPVFFVDDRSGRLQMRYTARTRSIEWRDDPATQEAADWMRSWLASGDPMMVQLRLKPGQGILNNNVLHNRTGFEDDPSKGQGRTILRVRFHDRIEENEWHNSAT